MPVGNPQHKGTGFLPVIAALRTVKQARELVSEDLWRYLDEPVLASAWYPERDFATLMQALAAALDPRLVGGNVWEYLGRTAAQRDLAGPPRETMPPSGRSSSSGLYRQFVKSDTTGPGAFFVRAKKIWQLYHDTGELEVFRRADAAATVVVRLNRFRSVFPGMVELQTAYMLEFARLCGLKMTGRASKSTAAGDAHCEWEYDLESTPEVSAWVQTLPEA